MNRRQFLGASVGIAGSLILGCRDNSESGSASAPPAALGALTAGQPLRALTPLQNQSAVASKFVATLVAAPASAMLLDGSATTMALYNGVNPGPLIELTEGQHVAITLEN